MNILPTLILQTGKVVGGECPYSMTRRFVVRLHIIGRTRGDLFERPGSTVDGGR